MINLDLDLWDVIGSLDQDLLEVGTMGEVTRRTASREITGVKVRGKESMKIDMTRITFLLYRLFSHPWFPSATVVVKGPSTKSTEEDLFQLLVISCSFYKFV